MYEAFISFKNLDEKGKQTPDSMIAFQLYNTLSAMGVNTFFSNAEIQRKADPRYATVIDNALREAKVVIVVGTKLEYIESRWVEYEWRYFSTQMNAGADKAIITIMGGFPLSSLPPTFAQVQNYSPNDINSAADMVCGILGKRKSEDAQNPSEQPKLKTKSGDASKSSLKTAKFPSIIKFGKTAGISVNVSNRKIIILLATTSVILVAAIILWVAFLPDLFSSHTIVELNSNVCVGDYVHFGSYRHGTGETKTPIEWRVLDIENGRALLISERLLDYKKFQKSTTWEDSSLREWMNGQFYKAAFNADERDKVVRVKNENTGNDTYDYVFCLSRDEAKKYFTGDDDRKAKATSYAKKQQTNARDRFYDHRWWLRSNKYDYVDFVDGDGFINYSSGSDMMFIRPAVWVSL